MNKFLQSAMSIKEKVVGYRRQLHQIPELSMELHETSAYVKKTLEKLGYKPEVLAKTGLVATLEGKKPGKVILIRADMDALPIKEEVDLPFKSQNDNMHACGHDMHTAMLLGAAEVLKEFEHELEGTVKFMFQPAEETLIGAKAMIEDGILEDPKVDAAMMIHVFSNMPLPSGLIILPGAGASSAASDWFEVTIQGKGGHGAMPDTTVDPLNVIAHLHLALQTINSREAPPSQGLVVTVGKMGGGNVNNVIPDTASLAGTVRTFDADLRDFVEKRIKEIADSTAKTFRAEAKVEYRRGVPSVVNSQDMISLARSTFTNLLDNKAVLEFEDLMPGGKMMGSEDFAFVSQEVPSLMIGLSAGNSNEDYKYPQHHPQVKFDEKALPVGVAAYASLAYDYLMKK